jgi:hypothetical protein
MVVMCNFHNRTRSQGRASISPLNSEFLHLLEVDFHAVSAGTPDRPTPIRPPLPRYAGTSIHPGPEEPGTLPGSMVESGKPVARRCPASARWEAAARPAGGRPGGREPGRRGDGGRGRWRACRVR